MRVVARFGWQDLGWGTPLVRAFATGELGGGARSARNPTHTPERGAFLEALWSEIPPARRAAWEPLSQPGATAVVTGQQPGCAGGSLLVLYKAATAVALARRLAEETRRPVVPIFWNATDDDDFEEISSVAWPDGNGLAFLELPRSGRRAGGWVGDLPAAGDAAAVRAARALAGDAASAALDGLSPRDASDHGEWVAAWLANIFPELAVLDARSPALRVHGAPLFDRYLERREAATAALETGIRDVERAGYTRTLDAASLRSALFWTPERRREKPGDDLEPLRRAVAVAPHTVSPNVVLRALLQDALLPTVAHVVGPSEIGYLLELRPLRVLLDVEEPALVPRLTMTVLPEPLAQAVSALAAPVPAVLADPEAVLRDAAREAAASTRAALAAAFQELEAALGALSFSETGLARAKRRLVAVEETLADESIVAARGELFARRPELARLPAVVRPRGQAQERLLAGLWLAAQWGSATGPRLVELASAHLEALGRRRPEHTLVVA